MTQTERPAGVVERAADGSGLFIMKHPVDHGSTEIKVKVKVSV